MRGTNCASSDITHHPRFHRVALVVVLRLSCCEITIGLWGLGAYSFEQCTFLIYIPALVNHTSSSLENHCTLVLRSAVRSGQVIISQMQSDKRRVSQCTSKERQENKQTRALLSVVFGNRSSGSPPAFGCVGLVSRELAL